LFLICFIEFFQWWYCDFHILDDVVKVCLCFQQLAIENSLDFLWQRKGEVSSR
jgi:hypothetical protein